MFTHRVIRDDCQQPCDHKRGALCRRTSCAPRGTSPPGGRAAIVSAAAAETLPGESGRQLDRARVVGLVEAVRAGRSSTRRRERPLVRAPCCERARSRSRSWPGFRGRRSTAKHPESGTQRTSQPAAAAALALGAVTGTRTATSHWLPLANRPRGSRAQGGAGVSIGRGPISLRMGLHDPRSPNLPESTNLAIGSPTRKLLAPPLAADAEGSLRRDWRCAFGAP